MKVFTYKEVLEDIKKFEGIDIDLDIPGIENALFYSLYSQVVPEHVQGSGTVDDLRLNIMTFFSGVANVIPHTDIPVDFRFRFNIFVLESIPKNPIDIYATQAKLILKTNNKDEITLMLAKKEHAFYIVVDIDLEVTTYVSRKPFTTLHYSSGDVTPLNVTRLQ